MVKRGKLFELGEVVMTRTVSNFLGAHSVKLNELVALVKRHTEGDWGVVPDEDKQANDDALNNGDRLLSAYDFYGERVWVITEHDRSVTTVLFPEDY